MKTSTAQRRWDALDQYRTQYLDRAINCSQLTIPSLIPQSDLVSTRNPGQGDESMPSLYQGIGSRGVNTLAAKLLLALYPPQQPFFRLTIDGGQLKQVADAQGLQLDEEFISKLDEQLSQMERQIMLKMEKMALRPVLFEAIKHLVVGGNGLLYVGDVGPRFYGLRSFCCDRDPEGNWRELVVKEEVAEEFLPPGSLDATSKRSSKDDTDRDSPYEVFTHVRVDPSKGEEAVTWYQEVEGKEIPGSSGFSSMDRSPWIPLRLNRIAGESYGRGLVEEVLGDLSSVDSLMQSIVEGSLAMAKLVLMVNPNGVTRADVLARANNGDVVSGNPADVAILAMDKSREFSFALQTVQMIERRLQFAFLTTEAIQRDAERVTAEEVRQMAEQLEQNQGGLYSILSQEMQLPLLRRVVNVMEANGELSNTPSQFVEPQITTGMDSIGRGNDRARLTQFLQVVAAALGPEALAAYMKPAEVIRRMAASDGIDPKGLVKTQEELQAETAQAEQVRLQQSIVDSQLNANPNPQQAGPPAG
jgi:hypothetical protein